MAEAALAVRLSIHIDAPREKVWQAFTTQEAWRDWFHRGVDIEPRVGGRFRIAGTHGGSPYVFVGTVQAFDPPREVRVSWAWEPPRYEGQTYLTFTLVPEGRGTRVELIHHGFDRLPEPFRLREYEAFKGGWSVDEELTNLKILIESGARAWG